MTSHQRGIAGEGVAETSCEQVEVDAVLRGGKLVLQGGHDAGKEHTRQLAASVVGTILRVALSRGGIVETCEHVVHIGGVYLILLLQISLQPLGHIASGGIAQRVGGSVEGTHYSHGGGLGFLLFLLVGQG